jgi:hypothetical protein
LQCLVHVCRSANHCPLPLSAVGICHARYRAYTRYLARCDMSAVAEMFKLDPKVDPTTAIDMVVTKLAIKQPA